MANTMVISVLERRAEIGLRRSLGALGGTGGVLLGIVYGHTQHWPTIVPAWAMVGGVAATLLIGAVASLYPAVRASRLAPTEALAVP